MRPFALHLSAIVLLLSCHQPKVLTDYEELSSHIVCTESCNKIIYSSNKDNVFTPYVVTIDNYSGKTDAAIPLPLIADKDFFPRSISHDCKLLALVSDSSGNQVYDIYLYNFENKALLNLTKSYTTDDGAPVFSPAHSYLAFLSDGHLRLYDHANHTFPNVPTDRVFKSVEWSDQKLSVVLEDDESNIWRYDVQQQALDKLLEAPGKSFVPFMASVYGDSLLFISDHDGFSQPYLFDMRTKSHHKLISVNHDIYAPMIIDGTLYFRMNTNGNIGLYAHTGDTIKTIVSDGVVYQNLRHRGHDILLYSSPLVPKTIARHADGKFTDLLNNRYRATLRPPLAIANKQGMEHLMFTPEQKPVKGWVLWIHGGPHEQVSPRFNIFFDRLIADGWGVIAMNYLGSTGIGNDYEFRGRSWHDALENQVKMLQADLDQIHGVSPVSGKFFIVGVSYGAMLTHSYLATTSRQLSGIIDISGLFDTAYQNGSSLDSLKTIPPTLFITGTNDYSLTPAKVALIKTYQEKTKTEVLALDGEGHFIRKKESLELMIHKMLEFMNTTSRMP